MEITGRLMTVTRMCALALLCVTATPRALGAQRLPRLGFEGALVRASVSGDDFQDTDAGLGWDLQGQLGYGAISMGIGYGRTSHHNDALGEYVTGGSLFLEPRVSLRLGRSPAVPYLAIRYARSELSLDALILGLGRVVGEQHGYLLLAGPGLAMPLSAKFRLEVAALYGKASFGAATVNGQQQANSERHGTTLHLRAGLSLRSRPW